MTNTFWKGRTVFITGASGLLGSWLTRSLLKKGANIVALVRDWVPESALLSSPDVKRITIVRGDIRDSEVILHALCEYEIDTVFHLAAQAIVGTARLHPAGTFETNIGGTVNLLEAARQVPRIGPILIASSDKAYGAHTNLPYTENTPLQGRHPYDCSKSCTDLIAQSYAWTYGMQIGITRCGNLFGGGDLNWNRLIPGTMRSVLEGKAPVIRSDGQFTRDYLYIEDGVSAYVQLAEALASGSVQTGEALNFGNKQPVTVLDVVQKIIEAGGNSDLQPEILGQASDEIREQYLDSSRAHQTLGWQPQYSLEDGLKLTMDWYRNFLQATQ
jgi:CDP-glucose 4,6-dehydratase